MVHEDCKDERRANVSTRRKEWKMKGRTDLELRAWRKRKDKEASVYTSSLQSNAFYAPTCRATPIQNVRTIVDSHVGMPSG